MVVLYGFGRHMDNICKQFVIPAGEIEVVIDNNLKHLNVFVNLQGRVLTQRVLTFNEFVSNRKDFCSTKIVIGSKVSYEEIKNDILQSKCFEESQIMYVDDWVKQFPRRFVAKSIPNQLVPVNARLYPDRIGPLYDYNIPEGAKIAEIGVALGEFSEVLLKAIHPSHFYAVDMFSDTMEGFWGGKQFKGAGITHEQYYSNKFKSFIENGKLSMHKGISWEVIKEIPDDSLDYAYIDAAHDYESVRNDINAIYPKMKKHSILQFNDYTFLQDFGVIPAVNEFVIKTNSEVLFYSLSFNQHDDIGIRVNK